MKEIMRNKVIKLEFVTKKSYVDPLNEVDFKAVFITENGSRIIVPGYYGSKDKWYIRFSSNITGVYSYETICNDSELNGLKGKIKIVEYIGDNDLYRNGPPSKGRNGYLETTSGSPFFWLGDTWWMGLSKRLVWPDDFSELAQDRKKKGFNVIEFVMGLYPDMSLPDERAANEGGQVFNEDYSSLNFEYFEYADRRIEYLCEIGLVPCIFGCWGFYMDIAGEEVIAKHWKYIVARYGAYPVVWCLAGEAVMPFYNNKDILSSKLKREDYIEDARKKWGRVAVMIRQLDPFNRLITVHPTDYGHKMVDDERVLDLNMLQTGHGGYISLKRAVRLIRETVGGNLPVLNGEACYEGILQSSYADVQRFIFWASILSGACGHTYGANGIWQVNTEDEPYGASPHGTSWGDTPWKEAIKLPGSFQVGVGKKLLEKYEWYKFERHDDWIEYPASEENDYLGLYCAGIPGVVRVIFIPTLAGFRSGKAIVKNFEKDVKYTACYVDPVTGKHYPKQDVIVDENGRYDSGRTKIFQDWILLIERTQ